MPQKMAGPTSASKRHFLHSPHRFFLGRRARFAQRVAIMQEWYYTRNGQQQGPVNLETLRNMAQDGSLRPDDMVWNSSMTDWVPSGEVDGIFSRSMDHATSPSPALEGGGEALTEIEPGSDPIGIGACVSKGFKLTTENFGGLFLVGLTYIGVMLLVGIVMGMFDAATGMTPPPSDNPFENQGSLINQLVTNLVSIFLSLGATRIGLNIVDGKAFNTGMLFDGGQFFIRAVIAAILFTVMMIIVCLPLIISLFSAHGDFGIVGLVFIPTIVAIIYLSLRFGFYLFAIVDKDLGAIEALQYSSRITTGQRLILFGMSFVMGLIIIAGLLALIIGVIFAIPVAMLSWVVGYRWLQYGRRVAQ